MICEEGYKEITNVVIIAAKLFIKPEKEAQFLVEAHKLIIASQAEEGVISYSANEDIIQRHSYLFMEVYEDEDALRAHSQSEHLKAFFSHGPDLFAMPPQVMRYAAERIEV